MSNSEEQNQEIQNYTKENLEKGRSKEEIKKALLTVGWPENDINQALSGAPQEMGQQSFPGAFKTLGQAWGIYRERFLSLFGVVIIAAIFTLTPSFLFSSSTVVSFFLELFVKGNLLLIIALIILAMLVFVFVQIWSYVALLYVIKDKEEKISTLEAYRRGWKKILPYIWLSLLGGLIIFGGILLLVLPGIIFSIWFSLAIFVLVAEDERGMRALLKSREYVRGRWWGVLWRFLFIGVLGGLVSFAISFALTILNIPFVAGIINTFIILILIIPLGATYGFTVYENLKEFKGGVIVPEKSREKKLLIFAGILGSLLVLAAIVWFLVSFFYFLFFFLLPK